MVKENTSLYLLLQLNCLQYKININKIVQENISVSQSSWSCMLSPGSEREILYTPQIGIQLKVMDHPIRRHSLEAVLCDYTSAFQFCHLFQ